MPSPRKTAMSNNMRRFRHRRGEEDNGQALIVVLLIAVALMTSVTFAVSSSVGNLDSSARYANNSQAQLTAQSGLSQATSAMAGLSIATLPCLGINGQMPLPPTANGNATYSVTIAYYSVDPPPNPPTGSLTCNGTGGTTLGTGGNSKSAILTSTGTILTSAGNSPKVTPVVMKESVSVTATAATLLPAFANALFSPGPVQLTASVQVHQVTGQPVPTVYGGSVSECTDGTIIQGNVYSYSDVNVTSNAPSSGISTSRGMYRSATRSSSKAMCLRTGDRSTSPRHRPSGPPSAIPTGVIFTPLLGRTAVAQSTPTPTQ